MAWDREPGRQLLTIEDVLPSTDPLVIIPCGQKKVWDKNPHQGPTFACNCYRGGPFKVNRAFAERFAARWLILSAKYGLVAPDFLIPGPYDVTFNKKATNPISVEVLQCQIREQHLEKFTRIIGLGGKVYRSIIEQAFAPIGRLVEFPFAGLPIGRSMQAIKRATVSGEIPGGCPR